MLYVTDLNSTNMTPPLTNLIQNKIKQQPHPPREVGLTEVVPEVLRINSMKFLLAFFLISTLVCFGISIFDESNRIFFLCFGIFSLFCSFTPFIYALRVTKAIRKGYIEVATVKSVNYQGPNSTDTLDSIENGMARGEWKIPSVGILEFEVDEVWAKKLSVGSQVELLVANNNSRGIFPLNIKS